MRYCREFGIRLILKNSDVKKKMARKTCVLVFLGTLIHLVGEIV